MTTKTNMKAYFGIRPCTWVYLTLIALTVVTYLIGKMGLSGLNVALFVLGLAMLKGHLVGAYFMGLGRVKGLWGWTVNIWLLIPGALITSAFYMASS